MRFLLLASALSLALVSAAQAQSDPSVTITKAWARPTNTANGAVYLTITNHAATDDKLTAASSDIASKVEMHATIEDNGVMRMRPIDGVAVKAGATVKFAPDGKHIMLFGLKHPLKAGDRFPLSLTFDKAGSVTTTVMVEKKGAGGQDDMKGMKM